MFVNLRHFDLNLLRSLDALLADRNVTRAAERLCVTQQAASGALQRLRTHFGDDLLARVGRNLELTPLAQSLVRPVREALLAAQEALDTLPTFHPGSASASCRIAMTDYGLVVLLPRFLQRLSAEAPHVKCHVESLTEDSFSRLEMGDLDFCLAADDLRLYGDRRPGARIRSEPMFQDDFVCVVDDPPTTIRSSMAIEEYKRAKHNSVAFGQGIETIVEKAWDASGFDIDVAVKAPTFSALIFMLPGTHFVATAQRRLANSLAPPLGLRILECPIPIPPLQENLMWHERSEGDPKQAFFRRVLKQAASELNAELPLGHKDSL